MVHYRNYSKVLAVVFLILAAPASLWAGVTNSDLAVTKTDGAASSIPGSSIVYTIVATNNGPLDDGSVTVTDTFPASLSGCTWTCAASAGSTCTAAGAGNIADSASLLNGGTATYTASCTIDPAATGVLANTATVSSSNTDPNMADNSATDTNNLTPTSDLSVTKTDGAASSVPGGQVSYTIVATNNGPSDATGDAAVTVTDNFPAELSGCTWTCAASAGSTCTAAGAGNIADSADLLSGGTATYTATCDIDAGAAGSLANTATVSSTNADPNAGDNSATDTNTLAATADLAVTLSLVPAAPGAGDVFSIFVLVENFGPSDATNVVVNTTLPGGLIFDQTIGCAEDPNGSPTCSLGTLLSGANVQYEIVVMAPVGQNLAGTITATVTSDAADPVPANDTDSVDLTITADTIEVPVAGHAGLMLLALLLALVAVGRITRS